MKAQILPEDQVIILNNTPVECVFELENVHAVTWNGSVGVVQYIDDTPNKRITSISDYADLLPVYWSAYGEKFKPTRLHDWDMETKTWSITAENQAILDAEQAESDAAAAEAEERKIRKLANQINNFSFEDIKEYIDNKVPPSGQTENINEVLNKLAELVKAMS